MKARIFSVGNELLDDKLDTNGPELARALASLGVTVLERRVLPDDRERLASALREALSVEGLVVTTGGLGPTLDDLTREAASDALGVELVTDEATASALRDRALTAGQSGPHGTSLRQAQLPAGATILNNDNGTAPGWLARHEKAVLLVLPGPPRELRPMMEPCLELALTTLAELSGQVVPERWHHRVLRVTGVGESDAAAKLEPLPEFQNRAELAHLHIAWLAAPGDLQIHFRSPDEARVLAALKAAQDCLGEAVYSADGRTLAESLVSVLTERYETVGTIESCTGGLLAAELVSVSGSSEVFRRGFVTYANEAKTALLGVRPEILEEFGAVSAEVAKLMALGGREAARSDWTLAVTGIAGPTGGSEDKPVGTVHFGLARPDGNVSHEHRVFSGDREKVRRSAVLFALDFLRRELP